MSWKEFFQLTKSKVIIIVILGILMNVAPNISQCVDGIDFGYCITYHGLPFRSFIISGEISNIPQSNLTEIIKMGIIGFLKNLLIAYLIISLVYFVYYKIMNIKRKNINEN